MGGWDQERQRGHSRLVSRCEGRNLKQLTQGEGSVPCWDTHGAKGQGGEDRSSPPSPILSAGERIPFFVKQNKIKKSFPPQLVLLNG